LIEVDVKLARAARFFDADLKAEAHILAFVGPSGAGKTTVLNMIAGLTKPDSGRIAIDGETFFDSARGIDLPARRRRLGYVFQDARLFEHMSVRANLGYGAHFAPTGAGPVKFDDVVDLLGVGDLLARRPRGLSGGERQRVSIGRALLSRPRALLLDEPLSAVDDARRQEILGLIEQLRDAYAMPILLVSHRLDEVVRLADRVADVGLNGMIRLRPAG
jgi:molybdate transport system ATP-binding protein